MFIVATYLFIFGLIIGSFLNVIILRYNTGKSLAGRSGCFSCGHKLSWTELIPVVSFLWQRGRCKHCHSKISRQYPIVEFLTGLLFAAVGFEFYPYISSIAFFLVLVSTLIVIVVHDLRHQIIADEAVYLLIFMSIISPFFKPGIISISQSLLFGLASGFVMFAAFFSLWFFSRGKWMGFGDAKLAFAIGALLGFKGGANAIILAFWLGALVGLTLIAFSKMHKIKAFRRRFSIKSEVPFAPFLALGLLLNLFFGISVLGF